MMTKGLHSVVLLPTYNHAPLLAHCLSLCDELYPQPDKYIFFENNSKDNTMEVIRSFKHPKEIIRMWFIDDAVKKLGNPYAIIGIARQYLLKRARQLNPEYVIFIDDDILLMNPDFITRIIKHKKDIVGAPYLRPFPEGMFIASKWKRKGKKKLWFKSKCKGFQKVHVTSAGCMCIRRRVFQDKRINFYPIIWGEKKASEDFGYCMRAHKYGYKVFIDCTITVGHYAQVYSYKPWQIIRDEKGEAKGYIEFKYGNETKLTKEALNMTK